MASNFFLSSYCAQAQANTLNAASFFSAATLTIYSGTQPASPQIAITTQTPLAVFTFPAYTSNSVSNGVITFGAISSVNAGNTGTASFFRISNGANVICDGSVGVTGCDLNINSVAISSGAAVAISSFAYTVSQ